MTKQFSPARAIWDNRESLLEILPRMRDLRGLLQEAIGGPRDFIHQQWLQLISVVHAFQPDLIIELGRGYGNSTTAFAMASKMLRPRPCRTLSLCLSSVFEETSLPYLQPRLQDATFFSELDARTCDIRSFDFAPHLASARRVFVFWDVHGYDLAIDLLSNLFPLLEGRQHLVVVHDMADLRHMEPQLRRYDSGSEWLNVGTAPPKYILGDVGAQYEEGIALVDFLGRNGIPFHSAESSYFEELSDDECDHLTRHFGSDFSRYGFWYYFSLTEAQASSLTYPPNPRSADSANKAA
jgi:hypothetical protein